ncbi:MAG: outer membrane protein transport protein [Candidatus Schekmanbacteria bacterium]|nr:outer membrane protein transport protein [Candidatus Schekmanbacteria bacterium]
MRAGAAAVVLLLWYGAPRPALASPWDTFGVGTRAVGLSGAMASVVDDWTAVYYNPAGLTRSENSSLGAGYFSVSHDLEINGQREPVSALAGPFLGASMKLGERMAFGISAMIPGSVVKLKILSPDKRNFVMYDNRTQRLELMGAGSLKLADMLSVGVGFKFLADAPFETGMLIRLPPTKGGEPQYSDFDVYMEITPKMSPVAGIMLTPTENLGFGLTFREEIFMDFDILIYARIEFAGFPIDMPLKVRGKIYHTPRQIVGSTSYRLSENLLAAVDLTWTQWSKWEDPRGNVTVLETEGPPSPVGVPIFKDYPRPQFDDTIVPRLGLEWSLFEATRVRAGYRFEKSPAPEQSGELNLVDNDKHVVALGGSVDLGGDGSFLQGIATIGAFAEYELLTDRTHTKSSADDPVGSYTSGGNVFQWGLDLVLRF